MTAGSTATERRRDPTLRSTAMDARGFLDQLRADRDYRGQITHVQHLAARPARYAEPNTPLDDRLRRTLAEQGIERFYTHQAAATDAVAEPHRQDLVVVTGTASGKTLCYNVPVLNTLLRDPSARALYLFPTKALAQDQLGTLDRLCTGMNITASTYDGDTSPAKRRTARHAAQIILSNPDMLHAGILPQHGSWARERFFTNLRYVVLDEIHTYRGTFGSHVAGVLRRLRRLCDHYGSDPVFICSSATIANPAELATRLIARDVTVIADDGSPRGDKFFVLWNPPFVDRSGLERRSANVEAQRLMEALILRGAQTITFGRARVVAELVYKYVSEALAHRRPDLAKRLRPYRGGYLANERRDIERRLFSGELMGVCCTNALELGIDVGSLDAALVVGFPGTICSLWQQVGRAGRSRDESLAILIAHNDPIDQYFLRHPEYFFAQSPEHAAIDPLNDRILEAQLKCAARELPLREDDNHLFGCDVLARCRAYRQQAQARHGDDGPEIWHEAQDPARIDFHRPDGRLPHHAISLRLMSNVTFDIIDGTGGNRESIGNVDAISAPELVYPNAVYLHEGREYLVRSLDWEAKIAHVERVEVDYYTQAVLADHCRVTATERWADVPTGPAAASGTISADRPIPPSPDPERGRVYFGALNVTWQTIAFKKIKYYTLEVLGQDALDLPPQTIHTTGVWATLPKTVYHALRTAGHKPIEAAVGIRNLLLVTVPMLAMCDRRDISGCVDSSNLGELALFVYDRYEGGLGYAQTAYRHFTELLTICRQLVAECPCREGCPSCVGLANVRPPIHTDPDVGLGFSIPNKRATVDALELWLRKEAPR